MILVKRIAMGRATMSLLTKLTILLLKDHLQNIYGINVAPGITVAPPLKKFHIMILVLFSINLGIAIIFQFFFLQNFSKINKRSPTFILESRVVLKGQIISKRLFGVFNFFPKTNENTSHSSKNLFWKKSRLDNLLSKLTDL